MWQDFVSKFTLNFIKEDRWKFILRGLGVTIEITIFALIIGIVIGLLVALVKTTYENTGRLKIANAITNVYLTIIRGTPVVVQLLIIYFVVFSTIRVDKVVAAVLTFGINSGAYQAEIFRAGIQSIPRGQFEAGRSLGFSYRQTMTTIIMPQAIKNILPALLNEFINLFKETAVVGYISVVDITMNSKSLQAVYYSVKPILFTGLVYYISVKLFSFIGKRLEMRLKEND